MRAWFVALLFAVPAFPLLAEEAAQPTPATTIKPPVAARKPVQLTTLGMTRTDDYAWLRAKNWREALRDPKLLPSEIREHLDAENAYAAAVLAPQAALRAKLVAEMKGRIEPLETGVPKPDGPHAYWRRYLPGAEQPQYLRAPRDGGAEEVLLDGNELAKGEAFFTIGMTAHSPDHRYYAYTVDNTGDENHTLFVRDLVSKRDLPAGIRGVSGEAGFAWADSRTLYYVRLDEKLWPRSVYRHRLGTDPARDTLVYRESDPAIGVSVRRTSSGRFIVISGAADRVIDTARPDSSAVVVQVRLPGVSYNVIDDWGDQFIITTDAKGAGDLKIVTAPIASPVYWNWQDLVPYREGRRILRAETRANHLVRLERENGLDKIVIRRKSDGVEHAVSFDESAYSVDLVEMYEYDTTTIRFRYSSPSTPPRIFDYDVETRHRTLRREGQLPGGHDPSAYVVRRLFARTADHQQVPITLLYRKGLALDGSAPMYVAGYGAFGIAFPADFNREVLSLVDRGFVYAIAHVRGGDEKGRRWHADARGNNKPKTFSDFIAVVEHLIKLRYTSRGRIVARGDSAGGLMMGAVANMRPDLFAGIVARVPFVDVLNTLSDDTLPQSESNVPEWGNPSRDFSAYRTIASYSPYENVKAQPYPRMLVTAATGDSRVLYWGPAKWVARLRAMSTGDAPILLVTRTDGHFGAIGRFVELDEAAMILAFALDAVGWREPPAGAP